ncbi:MAG: hypothetical protein H7Z14_15920, partial [Anaerolineae bacterium]|nr:hypothetical protein [Phycisphaerae bacterium]
VTIIPASSTLTVSNLQSTSHAISKNGAGALAVNNIRAASLTINAGAVAILTDGSASGTSRVGALSIAPPSTLDLTDNDLVVQNGDYAATIALVAQSRNGGAWDQPGIISSAARNHATHSTTLGVLRGSDYLAVNGNTFGPFTVDANDVLVKYTYYGDTDFNGVVDFDDYSRTDNGFNNDRTGWMNGDFDANGIVDFDDYSLIDQAFNTQSGTLRRAMSYLDGSDRSDEGMNSPVLQLVVDHFQQFGQRYATGFLSSVPEPTGVLWLSALAAIASRRSRRNRAR